VNASLKCEGCGKAGYLRSNCPDRVHPYFNHNGLWRGSARRRASAIKFRQKGREVENNLLHRYKTIDGKRYRLFLTERHLSQLLHPTQVNVPIEEVREEAMEDEADEAMVAGMDEYLMILEFISDTQVHQTARTPSRT